MAEDFYGVPAAYNFVERTLGTLAFVVRSYP